MPPGTSRDTAVNAQVGIPSTVGAPKAMIGTLVAVRPPVSGYLTIYPGGATRPATSDLNFVPRTTVTNTVSPQIIYDRISVYNPTGYSIDYVIDAAGVFACGAYC